MGNVRKSFAFVLHVPILLLLLTVMQAGAQGYAPVIKNFGPKEYGRKLSVANNAVIQDRRGHLYVANTGCVLEYDGISWRSIPVKQGIYISALALDSLSNAVYVGAAGEFGKLSPDKNGELQYVSFLPLITDATADPGLILRCYAIDGQIYFQGEYFLAVYSNNALQLFPTEDSYHLSFQVGKSFLVRERSKGLLTISNGKKELLSDDTLVLNNGIFSILPWTGNQLFFAIRERGLFLFDPDTKQFSPLKMEGYLKDISFNDACLLNHPQYRVAISSSGHGILLLDHSGTFARKIHRASGLNTEEIRDIFTDRSGNLWGVSPSGVHFMRINNPFEWYGSRQGIEGEVESVNKLKDDILVGTSSGLFINDENPRSLFRNTELVKGHVYEVHSHFDTRTGKELISICSNTGLYIMNGNEIKKISHDIFNTAAYDPDKQILLAVGRSGIYAFAGPDWRLSHNESFSITRGLKIERDQLLSNSTVSVFFVGLVEQGVIKILLSRDGTFTAVNYDRTDGLSSGMVRPFTYRNEVLFATDNGLQYFISEDEIRAGLPDSLKGNPDYERGMFDMYTLAGKTWTQPISGIAAKQNNGLWMVVDNQIWSVNDKGEIDSTTFLDTDPGMINSIYSPDGIHLFISGSNGLLRYTDQQNITKTTPLVSIRQFESANGSFRFSGSFGDSTKIALQQLLIPELPYSDNSIGISFSSPTFDNTLPVLYSWKLVGYEEEWTEWTVTTLSTYTNLHEGRYTFLVRAKTPSGAESEIASFEFTILPPWYRTLWAYFLYAALFVLLIFISIRIASYRLKQKNVQLEKIVSERTAEIAQKNTVLEHQNVQILHQKQEITDSITYAKRIQEAILPIRMEIRKYFPDSFVLFKPKDIVSGDFYWFHHNDNISMVVCADCTGHGVPGAFMSMICTDKLNHAVHEKNILQPGEMLSEVNRGIKRSLKQAGESHAQTKDGMDAAICAFHHASNTLTYSGANRPLWLIRNGTIEEYKPTKCAVGGFTSEDQIFEQISISIQAGDCVIMSSDGYADQFGGEKGKKMMVKTFKEKLLEIATHPMSQQEQELDTYFENWKNNLTINGQVYEQIDDVCVIGIRF
ncbi:MAG TPA: SpoIIE family protein phosphatase, partial [Flavobacteriales bacterium]|nr:SpoIIE family protein phosphatase [Flavobacteriales bacterium]